jgi:hypothetical protein
MNKPINKLSENFKWCLPLKNEEIEHIWETAIIIVDTNVLLDLYRYNKDTRNSILKSLKKFKNRMYMPYQVATEFFRNRTKIICEETKNIDNLEQELNSILDEHLWKSHIMSRRHIASDIKERLKNGINNEISKFCEEVKEINGKINVFQDVILEEIISLFNDNLGNEPTKEALEDLHKEAQYRQDNKIPPGYKDSNKEGNKKYGDYILWRQIIEIGKSKKKPIIFITSDMKDDWWERECGKTIGLLPELKKEAY